MAAAATARILVFIQYLPLPVRESDPGSSGHPSYSGDLDAASSTDKEDEPRGDNALTEHPVKIDSRPTSGARLCGPVWEVRFTAGRAERLKVRCFLGNSGSVPRASRGWQQKILLS